MKNSIFAAVLAIAVSCLCLPSQANIVITGTRVIYKSDDREVTVKLNNVGADPSLVQVWADKGNDQLTPRTADAPFLIMPPIFRVDPGKGQSLRLSFTGAPLPTDQESVFWLNVLDVPPLPMSVAEQNNYLQLAIRSRIKLFYRPIGLSGTPEEAAERLSWQLVPNLRAGGFALRADNRSAYFVSLNRARLNTGSGTFETDGGMIEPGGHTDFALRDVKSPPSGPMTIDFQSINDFGGSVEHHQALPN